MPAPESLKEAYADEMKDLWSANDQMTRAVTTMAGKAHGPKLKQTLEELVAGITKRSEALQAMLAETGEEVEKEHCKGMEGLVREALKHTTKKAPKDGERLPLLPVHSDFRRADCMGSSSASFVLLITGIVPLGP